MMQAKSLIRGELVAGTKPQKNSSPVDGGEASQSDFLSTDELITVFQQAKKIPSKEIKADFSELIDLANYFRKNHKKFTEQIIRDAGFIQKDAEDLVDCSIEFCDYYASHLKEVLTDDLKTSFSFQEGSNRKIKLTTLPYGVIAATTPRNTPLITELTIIVHALWSGNSLVLRPSPGVGGTVALLIEGLLETFRPETLEGLNITFADAKEFVAVSLDYANLLHYVGSSKYLETTLIAGIQKGVKVLVDGDGCSMVVVDSATDIKKAAQACYEGLIRCNGQICISVRVIVVEESVSEEFRSEFLSLIKGTAVGVPGFDKTVAMGPLFSAAQADTIRNLAKKYPVVSGEPKLMVEGENYLSPVVVELDSDDRSFLRESLFGPMVGLATFTGDGWKRWLEENPINLTDAVFSDNESFVNGFLKISKSPRKTINIDPTIESVFEPWGAFLPSGWNDVSYWFFKYRNYYQLVTKQE